MLTKQDLAQFIEPLTSSVKELVKRFDGLTDRVDKLTGRFDGLTTKVGSLTNSVNALDNRLSRLERTVKQGFSQNRKDHNMIIGFFDEKYHGLRKRVEKLEDHTGINI